MKLAIISDSHDNLPNIQKAIDWINKNNIKTIIHCGDLAAPAVLKKEFGPKFKGQFHFIHGNVADRELNKELSKSLKNINCHEDKGELELDGLNIAFVHFPWQAEDLAKKNKYDVIFYGHDHKPWEKQIGKTLLLNPGTLAGMFSKATFAVFDTQTKKAQLIILEKI